MNIFSSLDLHKIYPDNIYSPQRNNFPYTAS